MENVTSDIIRGNIDTIILKCLNVNEMYGLEIINYIRKASSDTYILKQPTLYSALKRLETKGLISSYWRDSAIGGRRHYYKLTETGKQSLPNRKDQWTTSKEVIDTLVDDAAPKKKPGKKPVLPVDDIPLPPVTLPHTVTIGMAINPYNPFGESEDDFLTLPFSILENTDEVEEIAVIQQQPAPKPKKDEDLPPLLKYAMAEGALSSKPSEQIVQHETNPFARYISPDDYASISTVKTGAAAKTAKIANYDIQIRPFTKHSSNKRRGDFHFVGKIRLTSAFLITVLLFAVLVVAYYTLKPGTAYSSNEQVFFTVGFTLICLYFVYYLVRFIASPGSKKAVQNQTTEHFVRLGIFIGIVISVLAINIIAGLTHVNSPDYLVFWAVPCILAATVYVEGIIQYLLRKTNIFVA